MSSLKQLAIRGTLWTIIGYGASQGLRLGANLILTRFLVPEAFGIMALINVFITGLNLFSDIGIGPSIVQNPRGDDPNFLNTAWTIQVIRGFGIWVFCLFLAKPLGDFYGNSQLFLLIPIIGFSMVIGGFSSTSLLTLNRQMNLRKLIVFDITVQSIGLIVMIVWARISPTIWSLVIGNLVMSIIKMVASHFLIKGYKNVFAWDKTALEDLVNFGRWILLTTAMTFLATQADKLILGKLFSLEFLGIYTVAYTFADLPRQIMNRLNSKVMFPVIAKQINLPRAELKKKLQEKRNLLLLGLIGGLTLLICFGDWIILTLYDNRYSAGAWMLPILAAGLWLPMLAMTIDPVLYALGTPQYVAVGNGGKFIYMLLLIPLGYKLFGTLGAVIVVAANDLPYYLAVIYGVWKQNLSLLKQDITTTLLLITSVGTVLFLRWSLGFGLPIEGLFSQI